MIQTTARGLKRRRRGVANAWVALPELSGLRRDLLARWARDDALVRRWPTLRELAGVGKLECADALLEQLIEAGCAHVDELFRAGRWWPQQVAWVDLPRLQRALGLQSLSDRDAMRDAALGALDKIAMSTEALREAALSLKAARLSTVLLIARTELLRALSAWIAEQRSGVRQDFALLARPHTKAITEAEWRWLESELDLTVLGIERNAAVLWLSGPITLQTDQGPSNLQAWPFIGVPVDALLDHALSGDPPDLYWVIENRASFERRARKRAGKHCVIWVPGRPSGAWLAAVARMLAQSPAPAWVSADTDPAGIEIALTVGQLWAEQGLEWIPYAMESKHLTDGKSLPLNDYDRETLSRTLGREDLPIALRALALDIERLEKKAEQEGWL